MADAKKGDAVEWNSPGGTAHGKVVRKATSDVTLDGKTFRASKADPKIVVETDGGKKAVHKPDALKKG